MTKNFQWKNHNQNSAFSSVENIRYNRKNIAQFQNDITRRKAENNNILECDNIRFLDIAFCYTFKHATVSIIGG